MDQSLWLETLRAVVLLRVIWEGVESQAQEALGMDAEVVQHDYRPDAWFPSYLAARRGDVLEVYVQGTSNNWQLTPHVLGGAVGQTIGFTGVVHSGFYYAGQYIAAELKQRTDSAQRVVLYGHSYGGAVAQAVAQELVDRGRDSGTVKVVSIGAPKLWNDWMGDAPYESKLVMNTVDPVPLLPPENTPVVTLGFLPPGPRIQSHSSWAYRGDEIWLSWDGAISDEYYTALSHPRQPAGFLGFDAHLFKSYRRHLQLVRESQGWSTTEVSRRLDDLFDRIDSVPSGTSKIIPDTTWVKGMEPISFLWFASAGNDSKGLKMANDGIWCKAHFRMGASGWSESYLFRPASGPAPTLSQANVEMEKLLTERVKFAAPKLRVGVHYYIDGVTYKRDGGKREGWLDWTPDIIDKTDDVTGEKAGDSEFPFMGFQLRLWSGDLANRLILLRPVPDTAFSNSKGQNYAQKGLADQAVLFSAWMASKGHWHIRARDRALEKKQVTQVITAALAAGLAQLTIPAHGLVPAQKIDIRGGDPKHKPLRGVRRVLTVTDSNNIIVDFGETPEQGYGGPTVQAVDYAYYPITVGQPVRVSKRDTGRPIKQGHGGR